MGWQIVLSESAIKTQAIDQMLWNEMIRPETRTFNREIEILQTNPQEKQPHTHKQGHKHMTRIDSSKSFAIDF